MTKHYREFKATDCHGKLENVRRYVLLIVQNFMKLKFRILKSLMERLMLQGLVLKVNYLKYIKTLMVMNLNKT